MSAIIYCVRHAEGFHNLGPQFHSLPDPKLTPVGEEQCLALRDRFPAQSDISLVTASPLSRTINTAAVAFEPALANGKAKKQILAIPDAQETSDFPCDMGSDADILVKLCEERRWPVDLSLVKDGWNIKTISNRYSPAGHAVQKRAREARQFIRAKAKELEAAGDLKPHIVLVSHGGFLHYFTNDWEESDKLTGTGWTNCEARSYTFESDDSPDAFLIETMESRKARGLDYPMLPHEKQDELFETSMLNWEKQGLANASKIGLPDGESRPK